MVNRLIVLVFGLFISNLIHANSLRLNLGYATADTLFKGAGADEVDFKDIDGQMLTQETRLVIS